MPFGVEKEQNKKNREQILDAKENFLNIIKYLEATSLPLEKGFAKFYSKL